MNFKSWPHPSPMSPTSHPSNLSHSLSPSPQSHTSFLYQLLATLIPFQLQTIPLTAATPHLYFSPKACPFPLLIPSHNSQPYQFKLPDNTCAFASLYCEILWISFHAHKKEWHYFTTVVILTSTKELSSLVSNRARIRTKITITSHNYLVGLVLWFDHLLVTNS